MKSISNHITYEESIRSDYAQRNHIKNEPGPVELASMCRLASHVFEPVREALKQPIIITSFYRSKQLNTAIGGAASSQHVKGESMDIKGTNGVRNADLFNYIRENLIFDQLIWEYGTADEPDWVHVSYSEKKNRCEILKAKKVKGRTMYTRL